MQMDNRNFNEKRNSTLFSFVRNASCSRGWLHLVVQLIFGIITVISFVLIVHMAYRGSTIRPNPEIRCKVHACRVVCNGAPYNNNHEEDIINAAMEADTSCKRIILILKEPIFIRSTLPANWLSRMRTNIRTLSIIGGNLNHIPPHAFMSAFATNVRSLTLEDITLKTWLPETFIGLSNLKELFIKNSNIVNIHYSALKTIDDTLKTLDIKATNIWNPINITGSANPVELTTVDFSNNIFLDTLNEHSFFELQNCKILYLNSCKITSLANGTLDRLKKIEILFLNNNFIHQVPVGLFDVLLALQHKPRINLQDNPWICKCSRDDLRKLHNQDLLIVEPLCYYPQAIRGITFSEFENYCITNNSLTELIISDTYITESLNVHKNNQTLNNKNKLIYNYAGKRIEDESLTIISPFNNYRCSGNRIRNYELVVPMVSNNVTDLFSTTNNWLKPIFYSKSQLYSLAEIVSYGPSGHGLLWFLSTYPQEIYCVTSLPKILRVYNVEENLQYMFCRIYNGTILNDECIAYDLSKFETSFHRHNTFLICTLTAFICLPCGALCVYYLIRKKPGLLKGSKRVLFVKHKQVDALVLPPTVPMRNDLLNGNCSLKNSNKNIFILSPNVNNFPWKFTRMNSTRSTNSNPSYISAIEPSADQLAQWRLRHHLGKDSTINSLDSRMSTFSWICDDDSVPYFKLDSKESIYDHFH